DKVLLPILGDQYGEALERQEIRLAYDRGAFLARYYDNTLPIAPDTWRLILDGSADPELERILAAADDLPARTCRESADIARRAAEATAVKRRLAMLVESRPEVRAHVDAAVAARFARRAAS
ncbi:MAG TPA: malto-oligosyltrehalose synthase, partial [Planctomycetota bacterium]|nr:malto-oligosyltrehalose synthase [Planctomycetota bacterium]